MFNTDFLPPDYSLLINDDDPSKRTITCLRLELTQDYLLEDRDLVVWADELILPESLYLFGKNICLFAREITVKAGVSLTVDGKVGKGYREGHRSAPGSEPGEKGKDGKPGSPGTASGNIYLFARSLNGTLTLSAQGGSGGRGQDGGNGAENTPGKSGKDAQPIRRPGLRLGQKGKNGKKGGDGGKAGISGNGGKAGRIVVGIQDPDRIVSAMAGGGSPGPVAQHGTPAPGSKGGRGGRDILEISYERCEEVNPPADPGCIPPPPKRVCTTYWSSKFLGRADSGKPGNLGLVPPQPPQRGRPGGDGVSDCRPVEMVELETIASWGYLSIVLREAELRYLNRDFTGAMLLFNWLVELSEAGEPAMPFTDRVEEVATAFGTPAHDFASQAGERAATLLAQIAHGQDYFGHVPNFTPLLKFAIYRQETDQLFSHAQNMENILQRFAQDRDNRVTQQNEIRSAVQSIKRTQDSVRMHREHLVRELLELEPSILKLVRELIAQQALVQQADENFRRAVEAQAGCSIENVLKAIQTVFSASTGIYKGLMAISGSFSELEKHLHEKQGIAAIQFYIKNIKSVLGGVNNVRQGWESIRDAITPEAPEAGKLVMEKKEFDEMIKPFLDLAAAADLKKRVARFLDLAEERNALVYRYNTTSAQIAACEAQEDEFDYELSKLRLELAQTTRRIDFNGVYLAISRHAFFIRLLLCRFLYHTHLSFRYWSLVERDFSLESDSLESLRACDVEITSDIVTQFENMTPPREQMDSARVLVFTRESHPELLAHLVATGHFSFKITPNDIQAWACRRLYINHIQIKVIGARTNDGILEATIQHHGDSSLMDEQDVLHDFTHIPVIKSSHFDYHRAVWITDGNLAKPDEGLYWGVGAIATWSVSLLADSLEERGSNDGLSRQDISSIEIHMKGIFSSPRG